MDKIKQYYQLILILVLLIALTFSVITRPESNQVDEYVIKNQIDTLESRLEYNEKLKEEYARSISLLSDSVITLNKQIKRNNRKLSTLQEEYDEKISAIDAFTDDDITRYFAERYGD